MPDLDLDPEVDDFENSVVFIIERYDFINNFMNMWSVFLCEVANTFRQTDRLVKHNLLGGGNNN